MKPAVHGVSIAWLAAALTVLAVPACAAGAAVPDFSGLWARTSLGYERPAPGHGGVENRMHRPNGASNLSALVGDYSDPLLKPAAAAVLKRLGEISLQGIAFPQPSNQCLLYPPPYISSNNQEIQLLQEKDRVTILTMFDHQFRHVRLNAQHPAHVTPSWYGDSVGHYEGDTLIVDTVGIRIGPYAMIDWYGTPHSPALHVVERYRLLDYAQAKDGLDRDAKENFQVQLDTIDPNYRGKHLQLEFTVEDQAVFTTPWKATMTYRPQVTPWEESICAENPHKFGTEKDVAIPTAATPDF